MYVVEYSTFIRFLKKELSCQAIHTLTRKQLWGVTVNIGFSFINLINIGISVNFQDCKALIQWQPWTDDEGRFYIQRASRGESRSQFQHWNLFIHNIQQFGAGWKERTYRQGGGDSFSNHFISISALNFTPHFFQWFQISGHFGFNQLQSISGIRPQLSYQHSGLKSYNSDRGMSTACLPETWRPSRVSQLLIKIKRNTLKWNFHTNAITTDTLLFACWQCAKCKDRSFNGCTLTVTWSHTAGRLSQQLKKSWLYTLSFLKSMFTLLTLLSVWQEKMGKCGSVASVPKVRKHHSKSHSFVITQMTKNPAFEHDFTRAASNIFFID